MDERRRVFFSGRVQGVGFRMTARRLASGFDVGGWVQNLPDGRVELVVQGESGEVRRFLEALRAEFARNLRGVEELVEPFDPEIRKGVTIRS